MADFITVTIVGKLLASLCLLPSDAVEERAGPKEQFAVADSLELECLTNRSFILVNVWCE